MIREIREEDKQLYMDLTEEFYNSEAVLHPIPEAYREATFDEMMRSQDYVKAYILEKDGQAAGYGLTSYTFSQEAGGKAVWLEELYIDVYKRQSQYQRSVQPILWRRDTAYCRAEDILYHSAQCKGIQAGWR